MTVRGERFIMLDGLRGAAAIAVLVLHNRDLLGGDGVFGHAYLAVDFFFMLSGFVLAHAYRGRLHGRAAFLRFMIDRAIRLLPLLMLGTVLGAIGSREAGPPLFARMAINMVGLPAFWLNRPFMLNPPAWSLFWEFVASAGFALVASGIVQVPLRYALAIVIGGLVTIASLHAGVDVGLAVRPADLWLGAPRVAAAFLIGTLVQRRIDRAPQTKNNSATIVVVILLASMTIMPNRSPVATIYDPLVILLLFPVLLSIAANSLPVAGNLAIWAGSISYPLYILHGPLIELSRQIMLSATDLPATQGARIVIMLLTIPASHLALRWYDEPVRRWLRHLADAAAPLPSQAAAATSSVGAGRLSNT